MSKNSDLKVIFYERAAAGKEGAVIADGYFSFVPTFKEGDAIHINRSRKGAGSTPGGSPIHHKTHRILATDWVVTVNDVTKEAVSTLIVSVAKIEAETPTVDYPGVVATHS